ncbi:serine acetyltransferase [Microvirga sesbaniae]|uniref:serine acetyltransferase n=1 Tax=Microvirga sesbaniae TaxID=681392 RepID=UPI0021C84739|nr:serine acetyltransferase [Microvirga sp. HBU67692]
MANLKHDIYRVNGRTSIGVFLTEFLRDSSFRSITTLRLYQAIAKQRALRPFKVPIQVLHKVFNGIAGMELPIKTSIGPALKISHPFGLVVNGKARIGANVTLFHGVTIGQADSIAPDGTRRTGYPVIEDDVWIGPHAVVVGDITVGMGSRILAGAVVNFDVPARSVVAGNPGAIIRTGCTPDVLHRAVLMEGRS